MAVKTRKIVVTDAAPVKLNDFVETDAANVTSNAWALKYGISIGVHVSAPLYWGGTNQVANSDAGNGAGGEFGILQPAGYYPISYLTGDEYWVIAPVGTTVTVLVIAGSV